MYSHSSNISRRQLLTKVGGGALLATLGAGCKRKSQSEKAKEIRFYGTATLDVGSTEWAKLTDALGAKMLFKDNGNDAGPIIAQMISGSAASDYDLGGLLGGAEQVLAKAGAILPWELSKIPNWTGVWQWAKDISHTRWDGDQYGIPLVVNADSMIYLPDRIKSIEGYESGIIDSYSAVFDPRLKGKTAMEDAWVNSVIFTAIYLKQNGLASISNPGNLTESELRDVMEFLIDKKKFGQFRKFWNGWEQGVEVIRSREVWVMTGWEPIVKALNDQGISAKYAVPKEGYEGWSIDLLLHSGAKRRGNVELCHEIADWMHSGFYGAELARQRGYAVPNTSTAEHANRQSGAESSSILQTVDHVQEKVNQTVFWQNVRPDNYRLYEEWWSKLRATT